MTGRWCLCWIAMLLVAPGGLSAQPQPSDTLRSYELGEIVVGDEGSRDVAVTPSTVQRVQLAEIVQQDAPSIAEAARLIPAAHVQTNSRGETLVYLRNAGERQVALFFDGALLNVPWDNRVDLSLVPSNVVGGMTVAKGVPSVLYGTNVLGGAVNLTARALENQGHYTEVYARGGYPTRGQAYVTHLGRTARWSYAGSVGYAEQTGQPLPGDADLPFSQVGTEVRTNTDRRMLNVYGQAAFEREQLQIGLSVLHLDGAKGVAPEGHLNPAVASVRYWRYPDWRTSLVILNGRVFLGGGTWLRGALWGSRFAQTIDQYDTSAFGQVRESQRDDDYTAGLRLTLPQPLGPGTLRLALNGLTSRHDQRNLVFDDAGRLAAPLQDVPTQQYRQHIVSLGTEYDARPNERVQVVAGVSLDAIATPDTGDKPARDPQAALGVTTGATYGIAPGWTLTASAGRKVRFPTMRELFGVALDRFLLNPNLRPESSLLGEVGLTARRARFAGEAMLFANRTYDTIDQTNVTVVNEDGEEEQRRQRINLDGSRVVGLEVGGQLRPFPHWTLNGHITWMHARGLEDRETVHLTEKPAWLSTITLDYTGPQGLSVMVQSDYIGRAYGREEDNTLTALPTALVLDARLGYRLNVRTPTFISSEVFVRVDNLTDAVTLPQLGLPGPGRELSLGLDLTI